MLIAVDFDDTLCRTSERLLEVHNELYGTDLTLYDLDAYHYWKTRGWGDARETMEKIRILYADGKMAHCEPVQGAKEACETLRQLGHTLVVVTARQLNLRDETQAWLDRFFPDTFSQVIFTGAFSHISSIVEPETKLPEIGDPSSHAVAVGSQSQHLKKAMSKAQILLQLGARVLIDDAIENVLDAGEAGIHGFLFGPMEVNGIHAYPWNLRPSLLQGPDDFLSWKERQERGLKNDEVVWGGSKEMPGCTSRVSSWDEFVGCVERLD